jgi:hypothetical protein
MTTLPGQVEIIVNELRRRASVRGAGLHVAIIQALSDDYIVAFVTEVLAIADDLKAVRTSDRWTDEQIEEFSQAWEKLKPTMRPLLGDRKDAVQFAVPGEGLETMAPHERAAPMVCDPGQAGRQMVEHAYAVPGEGGWRQRQEPHLTCLHAQCPHMTECLGAGKCTESMTLLPKTSVTVDLPAFLPIRKALGG